VFDLPRSARLVSWYNAWLSGAATPDDLPDLVLASDTAHSVVGLDADSHSLMTAAARLRRLGASAATLALPVPGNLLGLAGPPALNMAAVEVGEAALFPGSGLALVPEAVGAGVFWHAHPSHPVREVPDVRDAERWLRETLIAVAQRLTDLDVATWRPEIAGALSVLRDEHEAPLPTGYPVRATRLAALALRCQAIVRLAHSTGSAAVTSFELTCRDSALDDLSAAARTALVAACSSHPTLDDARAR
jgi:hypothetical protein